MKPAIAKGAGSLVDSLLAVRGAHLALKVWPQRSLQKVERLADSFIITDGHPNLPYAK